MYISPPLHGGAIAETILGDPQLRTQWQVRRQGPPTGRREARQRACCWPPRPTAGSPPAHPRASTPPLLLQQELQAMADAMARRRQALHEALVEVGAPGCWDHIAAQRGMFSFTGLTRVSGCRVGGQFCLRKPQRSGMPSAPRAVPHKEHTPSLAEGTCCLPSWQALLPCWPHLCTCVCVVSLVHYFVQAQCQHLTSEFHIYLSPDGRISLGGLPGEQLLAAGLPAEACLASSR